MDSGYLTTDFGQAIDRFYANEQGKLDAIPESELLQRAQDGPGPMMATEKMDIFFCAQEFKYTREFVRGMSIGSAAIGVETAQVEVISPLGWKTPFRLTKVKGRWRIAGYCIFQ